MMVIFVREDYEGDRKSLMIAEAARADQVLEAEHSAELFCEPCCDAVGQGALYCPSRRGFSRSGVAAGLSSPPLWCWQPRRSLQRSAGSGI